MSKVFCPTHPNAPWVNKRQLLKEPIAKCPAERTRVPPTEPPPLPPAYVCAKVTRLPDCDKLSPTADDDVRSTSTFTGWGSESDDGGSENSEPGSPSSFVGCGPPPAPPGLTLPRTSPAAPVSSTVGFVPPPGLPTPAYFEAAPSQSTLTPLPPPGLAAVGVPRESPICVVAPPGLGGPSQVKVETAPPYTPQGFRRDIMRVMRELSSHRNVASAVREVRSRKVPKERQAAEFADILTFAMEETRGASRRSLVAFVAGLVGAFGKEECVSGLRLFFDGVYQDLCNEVPKLAKLVKLELVPTLSSVLTAEEAQANFPVEFMTG